MANQTPEQKARDLIDKKLVEAGWAVQSKDGINLNAARGVAIREYTSDTGPMDYMLMVDGKPCGVIEAKKAEEAHKLSTVEEQSDEYSTSKLKFFGKQDLRFIYESTGEVTRIRDTHDPKTRAREVFSFMKPDTIADELAKKDTLRERMRHFPPIDPTGLRACQFGAITKLEESFGQGRPRALVQMATGSGKTFTAITAIYRLLKYVGAKLTEEQMSFLRMIRDHVSSSFHISLEDMEYAPFDAIGGPFRFRKLFGDRADAILDDLNAALAA